MAGVKGRSGRKLDSQWSDAIRKAINDVEDGQKKIVKLAEKLVSQALEGDITAMKEIGDRLEGKPQQRTEITGADGGPVEFLTVAQAVLEQKLARLTGSKPIDG
jgi:hypothetical protein